jgi:hypothetical protein
MRLCTSFCKKGSGGRTMSALRGSRRKGKRFVCQGDRSSHSLPFCLWLNANNVVIHTCLFFYFPRVRGWSSLLLAWLWRLHILIISRLSQWYARLGSARLLRNTVNHRCGRVGVKLGTLARTSLRVYIGSKANRLQPTISWQTLF